jgi:catechol 2,3-dioxygenase-like lactoylglutathione lyase family enzyme
MITGIDHIVILVADLDRAQAEYAAAGFTVVPGGEHAGGLTHNALVAFADGTYLELLAFRRPLAELAPGMPLPPGGLSRLTERWIARAAGGPGLLDFALLPTALAAGLAAARARGLALEGPRPGGRRRPDGQEVAWELGIPAAPDLPFLCVDVTPRDLRVPTGAAREHANGAHGVAGITVAVPALATAVAHYTALLGAAPTGDDAAAPGAARATFLLGAAEITLLAPDGPDDPLHAYLTAGGARPYTLQLLARPGARPLDPTGLGGARISFLGAEDSPA